MSPEANHWYEDQRNVVTLVRYLADRGDSTQQVVHAVEEPWRFAEEYHTARAILAERSAA